MSDSTNKRLRELCNNIRDGGGQVIAVEHGKHLKVKFVNAQGVNRMIVVSYSPSDRRASMAISTQLRRMLAEGPGPAMRYVA